MDQSVQHIMEVMDSSGDTKITWDPTNEHETECAEAHFNSLVKKGYRAFAVNAQGEKSRLVTEFDPNLRAIIMVPRIVGG